MPAAARLTDNHSCPLSNPDGSPHTGGPITHPGAANVLIGGKPAAVIGDFCTCAGPPDAINTASFSVKFGGKFAARKGDTTVHGGSITSGLESVIIG